MRLYTAAIAKGVFPLQEMVKGHTTGKARRHLEETQWWSSAQLAELQSKRLRALLVRAAETPYWGNLFAKLGFDYAGITGVQDLRALPLLDKATIRAHTEAMKHQRRAAFRVSTRVAAAVSP